MRQALCQSAHDQGADRDPDAWTPRLLCRTKPLAGAQADAAAGPDWLVAADSTLVRVHQHGISASRVGGNASTSPTRFSTLPVRGWVG